MPHIQKIVWIGCLSAIAAFSAGCSNVTDSNVPGAKASPAQSATALPAAPTTAAPTASPTAESSPLPAAKSASLIQGEVPEYDGSGRSYLITGTELQAKYSADQSLPLAVFMPENMRRFEENGRTAWGTSDKENWISFRALNDGDSAKAGGDQPEIAGSDTALQQYKEYQGGYSDGNSRVDVFKIQAKGQVYQAEIRTTAEQRKELLPLFVNVLREVQYMKKQPPLVAGVFVQKPDVGKSKESRQMLKEVMNCLEAIVAHDKEKFLSTMQSPETGDYLLFFIENSTAYRFTELTYEGIAAEGTQRATFNVSYRFMTDEGYQADQSYGIYLLRNKQGEWKVANID
ncbi:hypothetical protein [Paenibacillus jilunlii]|uniref:Uncharacterized protein n=1 Tax=Paenibacillus jilunlii TaxID=682956 RepID=A0A1G9K7U3_9BACL|nr:hypothetical protein [Paenibacillus jilunlii]KWX70012.1 hypothetical protein AML91_30200 [Paenibacillus jilunlii]SDL45828.1 hypothetical protein SAMN05216191_103156 [Paenibacillus jilunlii]